MRAEPRDDDRTCLGAAPVDDINARELSLQTGRLVELRAVHGARLGATVSRSGPRRRVRTRVTSTILGAKRDEAATILTADYLSETLLDGSYLRCQRAAAADRGALHLRGGARNVRHSRDSRAAELSLHCHHVATPLICIHPHFAGLSRRSVNELRCQFSGGNDDRAAHIDALIRELRHSAPPSAAARELSVHRDGIVGVNFADLTTALSSGCAAASNCTPPQQAAAAATARCRRSQLPPPAPRFRRESRRRKPRHRTRWCCV
jgi:hypothetical protein